jgi:hypothetical protein
MNTNPRQTPSANAAYRFATFLVTQVEVFMLSETGTFSQRLDVDPCLAEFRYRYRHCHCHHRRRHEILLRTIF